MFGGVPKEYHATQFALAIKECLRNGRDHVGIRVDEHITKAECAALRDVLPDTSLLTYLVFETSIGCWLTKGFDKALRNNRSLQTVEINILLLAPVLPACVQHLTVNKIPSDESYRPLLPLPTDLRSLHFRQVAYKEVLLKMSQCQKLESIVVEHFTREQEPVSLARLCRELPPTVRSLRLWTNASPREIHSSGLLELQGNCHLMLDEDAPSAITTRALSLDVTAYKGRLDFLRSSTLSCLHLTGCWDTDLYGVLLATPSLTDLGAFRLRSRGEPINWYGCFQRLHTLRVGLQCGAEAYVTSFWTQIALLMTLEEESCALHTLALHQVVEVFFSLPPFLNAAGTWAKRLHTLHLVGPRCAWTALAAIYRPVSALREFRLHMAIEAKMLGVEDAHQLSSMLRYAHTRLQSFTLQHKALLLAELPRTVLNVLMRTFDLPLQANYHTLFLTMFTTPGWQRDRQRRWLLRNQHYHTQVARLYFAAAFLRSNATSAFRDSVTTLCARVESYVSPFVCPLPLLQPLDWIATMRRILCTPVLL